MNCVSGFVCTKTCHTHVRPRPSESTKLSVKSSAGTNEINLEVDSHIYFF